MTATLVDTKRSEHDQRLVNEAAASQLAKLHQRFQWVTGKKQRLPIASNGRKRCDAELIVLGACIAALNGGQRP